MVSSGYDTNNAIEWKRQKYELEKLLGREVVEGRQHYLRFKVPETWNIWEENQMKVDSTLGYASQPGLDAEPPWNLLFLI